MIRHRRAFGCIGFILGQPGLGHMCRIDIVAGDLVAVHINEGAEILMRHRAVITFKEIINDRFPVGLDRIGQPVGKGERCQIRRIGHDLITQPLTLLGQRRWGRD